MRIEHEQTSSKGAYIYRPVPDSAEARLTYSRAGASMIIIDHTEVPKVYRGQNIGVALVRHAAEQARTNGWTVIPLCPFAAAQFRRHPEWADVLDDQVRKKH
jgi:hypothetical protein